MKRWFFLLVPFLCTLLYADISQKLNISTEDGTTSTWPWQLRVTNGSLTDNGDGTTSLTTGGGGGGGGGSGGTINAANQFSLPYYSLNGSTTTLSGFSGATVSTNTGVFFSTLTVTSSGTFNNGLVVHKRLDVGDGIASGNSTFFYVGGTTRLGVGQPGLGTVAGFDWRDPSGTGMVDSQMSALSFTFTAGFGITPLAFLNSSGLIIGSQSATPEAMLDIRSPDAGGSPDLSIVGVIGRSNSDTNTSRGLFKLSGSGMQAHYPSLEFGPGSTGNRDVSIYRIPVSTAIGFMVAGTTIATVGASSMTILGPNGLAVNYGAIVGSATVNDLTASLPTQTDANKKLISAAIDLSGTQVTNVLPVANGGTGTASPGLIPGTNITSITGTWPNQTINAATQSGGGGGSSALATGTGRLSGYSTFVSSPTSDVIADESQFKLTLTGASTSFWQIAYSTISVTASYTALSTTTIVGANCASACTVTLSTYVYVTGTPFPHGKVFTVAQKGPGSVTVQPAAGTINGDATAVINKQYDTADFWFDGTSDWGIK